MTGSVRLARSVQTSTSGSARDTHDRAGSERARAPRLFAGGDDRALVGKALMIRSFRRACSCPACGGASWGLEPAEAGTVEEVTALPVPLASVRLDSGPVVVARLEGRSRPGDRVELDAPGGAPVARPEWPR